MSVVTVATVVSPSPVRLTHEQALIRRARLVLARKPFWVVRCRGPLSHDADGCLYSGRSAAVMGWIVYHATHFGLQSLSFWDCDTSLEAHQWVSALS